MRHHIEEHLLTVAEPNFCGIHPLSDWAMVLAKNSEFQTQISSKNNRIPKINSATNAYYNEAVETKNALVVSVHFYNQTMMIIAMTG